jgi:hypothetical protein
MNRLIFTSFLLALLSYPAAADKLARISISTLLEEASLVAIVKVDGASLLDGECGVKYSVAVVDPIKNTTLGARVSVSDKYLRSAGLRVGKTFILFESQDKVCGPVISHAGYAAFAVESPLLIDYDVAVRIPKTYVELPKGLPVQPGQRRDEESTEVEWAEMKAFLQQLKGKP